MSGVSLDQAVANQVSQEVEVTLAAVLPIVTESEESLELTKAEVSQVAPEIEMSMDTLLNIMSEVPKND